MRILYFTTFDLTLAKGPSINEREFVGQMFRDPGIQVRAIVPGSAIELDEFPKEGIRPFLHSWGPSIRGIISSEREVENAIRLEITGFGPDIVVGRLALLPFGCLRALGSCESPFAIKSLGSAGFVTSGWNTTQMVTRCLRPLIRYVLRRVVRRACVIDSTTNELRSLLIKEVGASPSSTFVVPNATNTVRFRPLDYSEKRKALGIPQGGVVVGYAGGDPLERGGREVIEVVARLRAEGMDAYGLVVGGRASDLLRFAQQYEIAGQFHAPGRVDYATMPDWINLIDIGIALDRSKRAAQIGNSYQKIRQFIACGRFIITQIDDSDPIAECPLVVRLPQKNREAIYFAVRQILEMSKEERETRQIAGRAFAEQHLSLSAALETRIKLWKACIVSKETKQH
jgi:glycosyltransferase involved in cell wall biosynthesis